MPRHQASPDPPLVPYELERKERILQNQARLKAIGLTETVVDLARQLQPDRPKKAYGRRTKPPPGPIRRCSRLVLAPRKCYVLPPVSPVIPPHPKRAVSGQHMSPTVEQRWEQVMRSSQQTTTVLSQEDIAKAAAGLADQK